MGLIRGPFRTFVSTVKEGRRHLAAAAVARAVSIFAMYPVGEFEFLPYGRGWDVCLFLQYKMWR